MVVTRGFIFLTLVFLALINEGVKYTGIPMKRVKLGNRNLSRNTRNQHQLIVHVTSLTQSVVLPKKRIQYFTQLELQILYYKHSIKPKI